MGKLPIRPGGCNQKERRSNRYAPLACLDENIASVPFASGRYASGH